VSKPLLEVDDLTVEFHVPDGVVRASDALTYQIYPGEILGVVGESGSGKTVNALALLGLLPAPNAEVVGGKVLLDGRDLLQLGRRDLRSVRGKDISIIFQDPLTSLNPVFTIERQIIDALVAHGDMSKRNARERARELLELVGVPDAADKIGQFPHQWSGGMRQRALIAMALANRPRLVIADEPTTALDVTIQAQVMRVLEIAQRDSGAAMMLITHDLALVGEFADRVLVMYAGRIVEQGPVRAILSDPRHPYTRGLLGSVPRIDKPDVRLSPIPGNPPNLIGLSSGCAFEPRCSLAGSRPRCREVTPELVVTDSGEHLTACHYHDELASHPSVVSESVSVSIRRTSAPDSSGQNRALETNQLVKEFDLPRDGFKPAGSVRAVDGVSLSIERGTTLGLVGESGCGKSTLAWMVAGLVPPDGGRIVIDGVDITDLDRKQMRGVRRKLQIVFQDPLASLDPKLLVQEILLEPLVVHKIGTKESKARRVVELLDLVGLDPGHGSRYPHELSGGQRQRVAIARALALDTELLILDEPVSALDVSIQAQIISLLRDIQLELGLSLLFISHDLAVVHALSNRVAVMYLGRIVEVGDRDRVYQHPSHPYTQALLAAVPRLDRPDMGERSRIVLESESPTTYQGSGCRFQARCWKAEDICQVSDPDHVAIDVADHSVACHFPEVVAPTQ